MKHFISTDLLVECLCVALYMNTHKCLYSIFPHNDSPFKSIYCITVMFTASFIHLSFPCVFPSAACGGLGCKTGWALTLPTFIFLSVPFILPVVIWHLRINTVYFSWRKTSIWQDSVCVPLFRFMLIPKCCDVIRWLKKIQIKIKNYALHIIITYI